MSIPQDVPNFPLTWNFPDGIALTGDTSVAIASKFPGIPVDQYYTATLTGSSQRFIVGRAGANNVLQQLARTEP